MHVQLDPLPNHSTKFLMMIKMMKILNLIIWKIRYLLRVLKLKIHVKHNKKSQQIHKGPTPALDAGKQQAPLKYQKLKFQQTWLKL